MVKNIRYILTRILIGVGVVIALQFIQGTLIGNVHAETISWATNNNSNFMSCTSCSSITYDYPMFTNEVGKSGRIVFSALTYGDVTNGQFLPFISLARVTSSNVSYNCEIASSGLFSYTIENTGGQQKYGTNYSISCPVTINTGGISSVYIQLANYGGISLYSPATFIVDDSTAITNAIEDSTQQQIESQKVCKLYDKSSGTQQGYLNSNGTINTGSSSSDYVITKFINITSSKLEALSNGGSNVRSCFYNVNKSFISCINTISVGELTIPTDATYVRFSIQVSNNRPTFKICQNGNQSVVDSNEQLNDTLNDNDVSSGTSSSINDVLASNDTTTTFGPVADLLLLPLTLFGAFYSGFNGTCATFDLGSLFNTNLTLPCINLQSILGSGLYNTIDVAISLFMIFNIVMMCIDIFDRLTSFEDPFNELYTPKHTYQPKHGGGR